jgi:hypothetical protein
MNARAPLVRLHQLNEFRQEGRVRLHHPLLDLELRDDRHDAVVLVPRGSPGTLPLRRR